MHRLLVFDVDKTLLNSNKEIPVDALDDIHELKKNGYLVTIASGRAASDLQDIVDTVHCDIPFICSSGACIVDQKKREILMQFPISQEIKDQVVHIANTHVNMGIVFHFSDGCVCDERGFKTWQDWYGDLNDMEVVFSLEQTVPAPLKIDILGEKESLVKMENDLAAKRVPVEISSSSDHTLEITARGVSKGSGLMHLSAFQNIPLEQIIVFGDSANDLSMFTVAGYSVCLGSTNELLMSKATLIAPDSDQNGLSWALRKLFKYDLHK
jgi:Cof subfamily protein (haloacid dehalogenase superfamily)